MNSVVVTILGVHLLGLVSPGPDFAMILRNSLSFGRRYGVLSALGIALGLSVHIAYSILGISLLMENSPLFFTALKWIGALFLLWLGVLSLGVPLQIRRTKKERKLQQAMKASKIKVLISFQNQSLKAILTGFFTNLLNVKAAFYIIGIFSHLAQKGLPFLVQALCGFWMVLLTFIWFALVASVLNIERFKIKIQKYQHWIERVMGVLLILIALQIMFSNQ